MRFAARRAAENRSRGPARSVGTRGGRSPPRPAGPTHNRGDMLLSLFSAFAVGLALTIAVATIAVPIALGLFDRRDVP